MKTIGEKLKNARIERGIVQRRMAKDLGLTVQSVLNVENGKCLKVATLERIAKYLGVEIVVHLVEVKN
jgi:transcriptional regulator with XRE-family HTH domain